MTSAEDEFDIEDVVGILNQLFTCLRSPVAPLRSVAQSCALRIAKYIISRNNTEMSAALQNKLNEALIEFKSRKNAKISRKLFEELLVRYPDFAIPAFSASLVTGVEDSKGQFIQVECCELLMILLSRFKTLPVGSQAKLIELFPRFLSSLSTLLLSLLQAEESKGTVSKVAGKRMKAVANCIKETLLILKPSSPLPTTFSKPLKEVKTAATALRDNQAAAQSKKGPLKSAHLSSTTILLILGTDISTSSTTHTAVEASDEGSAEVAMPKKKRKSALPVSASSEGGGGDKKKSKKEKKNSK